MCGPRPSIVQRVGGSAPEGRWLGRTPVRRDGLRSVRFLKKSVYSLITLGRIGRPEFLQNVSIATRDDRTEDGRRHKMRQ